MRRCGHQPVLLDEMLAALAVRAEGVYLDATFGVGGYSRAILAAGAGRVLAIDRDPAAVARGRALARTWPNFTMLEGCFGDAATLLGGHGVSRLDGAVLDLGVSSPQLDDAARGFSFTRDGPLDMRMSAEGLSAADVVNGADEATLADILYRYGEERASRRIARAIVLRRQSAPIQSTAELAALIAGVLGRQQRPHRSGDPQLPGAAHPRQRRAGRAGARARRDALAAGARRPPGGGRLPLARGPAGQALPWRAQRPAGAAVAPSARPRSPGRRRCSGPCPAASIRPGPAEIAANPRARSARLRAAERLPADPPAHEDTP